MAALTITIPNPVLNRVLDGYAYQHGYQDQIPGVNAQGKDILVPNPETKALFVRRLLKRHILNSVQNYETQLAEKTARQTAISGAQTALVGVDVT